ncbi:reversion-inducing cysteine-rich protein with Kazal motifs-like [Anneissia japonica]|uniref:reversion-inducing cysteine-rich protein with Kazal motifs-like n=1 Tax=Anneissia japonica TaxID=1529436 RepID=UPI00142585B4|nr:reversion-inducing cysteine-rich protein with Kazal motifs-like [Anneissia japonica]
MRIIILAFVLVCVEVYSQDPSCCHKIGSYPSCQGACDLMAIESTSAGRRQHVGNMKNRCPPVLTQFWTCVNKSAPDIWQEDVGWFGKVCCINAQSSRCHTACMQADVQGDLSSFCNHEDEGPLYQCINRLSWKKTCCQRASSGSICLLKCAAVFDTVSPTEQMALDAKMYCAEVDENISTCVNNYTRMTQSKRDPKESLHCCERSPSNLCRETCRHALNNMTSEENIIAALIKDCDKPLVEDEIWQCFLLDAVDKLPKSSEEEETLSQSNIDGAKLSCCHKAVSLVCVDLCLKLHTTENTDRSSWDEFETKCKYRSAEETAMLTCLDDVEEPCEPGCSGLEFCTNFNGRPTELFRSCNAHADRSAREDMNTWMEGLIKMPHMSISVQNIRDCEPEKWKAIACSLQIKPCHPKSHGNMICKSDCVEILTQCINQESLEAGASIQDMCDILSPADEDVPCISLQDYLYPSEYAEIASEVTHPCSNDPCKNSSVTRNSMCTTDRTYCGEGDVCFQHKCQFGCKLGGSNSPFLVPQGSLVRVPDSTNDLALYMACRCGQNGLLENFKTVPSIQIRHCNIAGQQREHESRFSVDCNMCVCYGGVSTCSNRQCLPSYATMEEQRRYTGLPCNCADQFVPVCALNGKTYPSACLARCVDIDNDQFIFGMCGSRDPCSTHPCQPDTQCIPNRQVCLSLHNDCPQYKCIPNSNSFDCENNPIRPVCDSDGEGHLNLCFLHQAGKTFAYNGDCKSHCDHENTSPVCGQNGETYSSICEAWSDRTTVDYYGACQAVGTLSEDGEGNSECFEKWCPSPAIKNCIGITPPGACCPVCAGEVQVLFSEKIAENMSEALNGEPITVNVILELLRDHVAVAECDLFGYMSIEKDLILLITPIIQSPTELQIEACNTEAEKIAALINTQSPTLVSYVHLSPLLAARTRLSTPTITNSASPLYINSQVFSLFVVLYFVHIIYLKFIFR